MSEEVEVRYFAAARELCGTSREHVRLTQRNVTARAFLQLLAQRHAALAPVIRGMRLAVNDELVGDEHPIHGGDQVAVLPPVAGGTCDADENALLYGLRETPLSVDEVMAALRSSSAGGIALFVGVVRDHADGKPVARLEYEAHLELAERELKSILQEVARSMPGVRLASLHRIGTLDIGEVAVVTGASAAHRAEAFAACRQLIELIKQRVPIWKKEWAPDGTHQWVNLEAS